MATPTPARPTLASGGSTLPETRAVFGEPNAKVDDSAEFTLADVDPIGRIEVMIYGPPGSGKSVMASTFPPPFRWLAADGQNSLKSVRWAASAKNKDGSSLTQIRDLTTDLRGFVPSEIQGYADDPRAFRQMEDRVNFWFSKEQVDKWTTLVLDSATELNEWSLNLGLSLNNKLPDTKKPLSVSHEINKRAKIRILTGQQDYKSAQALFDTFIGDVRTNCARHNKNLVLCCHEFTDTDDDGNIIKYRPMLIGQLRERLGKDFDDIWYMQVYNGTDFKVMVHADPRHIAKTRWGQVLNREEPANFQTIFEKVKKHHGL